MVWLYLINKLTPTAWFVPRLFSATLVPSMPVVARTTRTSWYPRNSSSHLMNNSSNHRTKILTAASTPTKAEVTNSNYAKAWVKMTTKRNYSRSSATKNPTKPTTQVKAAASSATTTSPIQRVWKKLTMRSKASEPIQLVEKKVLLYKPILLMGYDLKYITSTRPAPTTSPTKASRNHWSDYCLLPVLQTNKTCKT